MEESISILKKTALFSGVAPEHIAEMMTCLSAKSAYYDKNQFVFRQGDMPSCIAVLVKGKLHLQKDDYWGNRSIISSVVPGEMFGEAYALSNGTPILHDVVAVEDSTVVFFDANKTLTVCPSTCPFHARVIRNLFSAVSEKNRKLVGKLGHMAKRTTKEKLLSYLSEEADKQKCSDFEIPFNRQQLADYLAVDRSAMSNELCRLRDSGVIAFHRNHFTLLSAPNWHK